MLLFLQLKSHFSQFFASQSGGHVVSDMSKAQLAEPIAS
jgi:hypothetical protein